MDEFIGNYEYILAWSVYFMAGFVGCAVWWRMTRFIHHRGWRELTRGMVVVLIYTPWYVGDTPEFYAPAIVVLLMDLLIEGAKAGLGAGVSLLVSTFLMLCVLTGRMLLSRKPGQG